MLPEMAGVVEVLGVSCVMCHVLCVVVLLIDALMMSGFDWL